jgi:2-polyprenyl-3-methyl-5-hydroxy-6-metoxy-1,4-benzoquinol methylase
MSTHQHGHGHGQQHGEHPVDEASWDERYRSADAIWSGSPNPVLVTEGAGLPVGHALDVGAGEGADAIWLAARGWRVDALDISSVALERAAAHAAAAGDGVAERITWLHADLTAWTPPRAYDLVSAHYLHLHQPVQDAVHRALAAAVAPGGTLLVVGHAIGDLDDPADAARRPRMFTAADVAAVLEPGAWDVHVDEQRPRPRTVQPGTTITINDAVLRARRRA